MKKYFTLVSSILGATTYLYLIANTYVSTGEGLSFTTFFLWAFLAWISAVTTFKQKSNALVPTIYAFGSSTISILLFAKGKVVWTGFDTFIAVLVLLCMALWMIKGSKWALVMSVLASLIANIPFIIMTWRAPEMSPIVANFGFFGANFLWFLAGEKWTLQDKLYGASGTFGCSLLLIPWFLK